MDKIHYSLCGGFYPVVLCIPKAVKEKIGSCVSPGLDIIRASMEKDYGIQGGERVCKHVVEMIDNRNQIDREENEAGLRLMSWGNKVGL